MSENAMKDAADKDTDDPDGLGAGLKTWLTALQTRLGLQDQQTLRDTLETALKDQTATEASFSNEEREMLLRLLRFGASRVDDIMVPRADITAIDESESLHQLVLLFEQAGVSRIPVFHDTLDDPRGMIHIKDLFGWLTAEASGQRGGKPKEGKGREQLAKPDLSKLDLSRPITVAKVRRPVLYAPPSMPAMNLLIKMQSTRVHMALVVDEYGGTDGLVTIEDLVEQIVGDIEDEHDEDEDALIYADPKIGLVALARTPVDEVEERLEVKLLKPEEEDEVDTLGGLVYGLAGRIPVRGELIRHPSGVEFEVLDADPRRIKKLKIHPAKSSSPVPVPAASNSKT